MVGYREYVPNDSSVKQLARFNQLDARIVVGTKTDQTVLSTMGLGNQIHYWAGIHSKKVFGITSKASGCVLKAVVFPSFKNAQRSAASRKASVEMLPRYTRDVIVVFSFLSLHLGDGACWSLERCIHSMVFLA